MRHVGLNCLEYPVLLGLLGFDGLAGLHDLELGLLLFEVESGIFVAPALSVALGLLQLIQYFHKIISVTDDGLLFLNNLKIFLSRLNQGIRCGVAGQFGHTRGLTLDGVVHCLWCQVVDTVRFVVVAHKNYLCYLYKSQIIYSIYRGLYLLPLNVLFSSGQSFRINLNKYYISRGQLDITPGISHQQKGSRLDSRRGDGKQQQKLRVPDNRIQQFYLMPKIRKQPRRSTKKQHTLSLRNPFLTHLPLLPDKIAEQLRQLERIIPTHLDEIVSEPEDPPEINISIMKQALDLQQLKISELKQLNFRPYLVHPCRLEQEADKSSNELLDHPVEANNLDWMAHHNESVSFF